MKTCLKCGATKERAEFYATKSAKDGLKSYCKPCCRELWRDWKRQNPERRRAQQRRHWQSHSAHYKAKNAQWKLTLEGKASRARSNHRRRLALRGSIQGGDFSFAELQALKKRTPNCLGCGEVFTVVKPATIDHKVPISRGGTNAISNIQLLCHSCNARKGANMNVVLGVGATGSFLCVRR